MKRKLIFQLIVFIITRTVVNTMVRMIYPFLPVFSRGLGVSLSTLSWGITLRQATGIFGPLLASVGDTYGRKAGMLLGLALFIAGAGIVVVWPVLLAFIMMLSLGLMTSFVFVPSMQAFLGDRVPYRQRGLVLGLTEYGWSLAFILGVPIVGYLIATYGWQAPFPWFAAAGMVMAAVLAVVLPRDVPLASERSNLGRNLRLVWNSRSARATFLFGMCLSGSNELINIVFGAWLEDTFLVKVATLAAASAVIGFSELGGETAASLLSDRMGKHRATGSGLILNALAVLLLPLLGYRLGGAMAGLFLFYLTFEFTVVSSIPLASEVLPAARATLMSIYIASMGLGRALGAPLAAWLYELESLPGIWMVVLTAMLVILAALVILRQIKIETPGSL